MFFTLISRCRVITYQTAREIDTASTWSPLLDILKIEGTVMIINNYRLNALHLLGSLLYNLDLNAANTGTTNW